jgi:hypothetical protein
MKSDDKGEGPQVTEIDDGVLRDLASKFADVACPIHNVPPRFEVDEAGGVVEHMCCETLLRIVRELQANEESEKA